MFVVEESMRQEVKDKLYQTSLRSINKFYNIEGLSKALTVSWEQIVLLKKDNVDSIL